MRQIDVQEKQTFEGGATRSVKDSRLDLIPASAARAMGRRLALGAAKHGENNWRGGGEEFRKATINHLLDHIFDYAENGNKNDKNTDAIICNAAFLCEFEERRLRADGYYTKEALEALKKGLDNPEPRIRELRQKHIQLIRQAHEVYKELDRLTNADGHIVETVSIGGIQGSPELVLESILAEDGDKL